MCCLTLGERKVRQGDVIYLMLKRELTKADVRSWWAGDLFGVLAGGSEEASVLLGGS